MIFINHRHADALWVGRLVDALTPLFGADGLYVDRQLEPGDRWPDELEDALQRCDALIAVIGEGWARMADAQGRRRLDDPRDWVRREIETALARGVLIVPVFLDGCAVPAEAELPASLQPLCQRQGQALRTSDWEHDLQLLAGTLAQRLDVRRAQVGLGTLGPLLKDPQIALELGGSRQGVERTLGTIQFLQAHKAVHDALHRVEHEIQRPIRSGGLGSGIIYRRRLAALAQDIRAVMDQGLLMDLIVEELEDLLAQAKAAMDLALQGAAPEPVQRLLADLEALIAVSPELDSQMSGAAATLQLSQLSRLMRQVQTKAAALARSDAAGLAQLGEGIAAIERIDRELQARVLEHSTLQMLDRELRAAMTAGERCEELRLGWAKAQRRRRRLVGRASLSVTQALPDFESLEQLIDAALAAGQGAQAASLLTEYFGLAGDVFFSVDTQLRDYCHELGEVAQALRQWLPPEN
ncbi:MAG TPA: toll/interleukin-1 receptor domain-containing protein [Burkholderiaceae bacterium]|nr:toll/interleukin-1 receptor domain-containing protein [Burkholderiaceae bacterium]HMY98862.1 toll/interleukin-1 receptor domain-containing protein [Burkholderiaceae bacterium]HNG79303.1 toll/interleukin-1 receptor domain-containing protein [Burkholderiaceae bacterium]